MNHASGHAAWLRMESPQGMGAMIETITITNRHVVGRLDGPKLSHAEQVKLAKAMDREIEKTMFGGWPAGYERGKGMPGTFYLGGPPRCCRGVLLHERHCKHWGVTT